MGGIILRFRSKDGMFRAQVGPNDDFSKVLEQLSNHLKNVNFNTLKIGAKPGDEGEEASKFVGHNISELQLKHGDLLFLTYESISTPSSSTSTSTPISQSNSNSNSNSSSKKNPNTNSNVNDNEKQLPIDDLLDSKDGYMKREKQYGQSQSEFSLPVAPWDAEYQKNHKIKHLSFHSHVKHINDSTNKNAASSYVNPLSEPNFKVKKNCPSGHKSWPNGICSKCQPSAITLQRQEFRMVDHVEFADSSLVNNFLDSWRSTGYQRLGYLYGRYESYEEVPLGIKAVVEVIYEPAQNGESDGLTLNLEKENEEEINKVDEIAKKFGLRKIGIIFTDLIDSGKGDGSVICKRHKDSYFLTSIEAIFAAKLQCQHPNVSKWSDNNRFSSKFVTCVVSGNIKGEIDIASYQVSTEAEAMVKADLVVPSTHASMVMIQKACKTRYVPDIFYTRVNEYGITVKKSAEGSFPVEYFLVTLTHGFPSEPKPLFKNISKPFVIENRQAIGSSQDISSIAKHFKVDSLPEILTRLSDFHLLTYLHSLGILKAEEEQLAYSVAAGQNEEEAQELFETPGWKTLVTILSD